MREGVKQSATSPGYQINMKYTSVRGPSLHEVASGVEFYLRTCNMISELGTKDGRFVSLACKGQVLPNEQPARKGGCEACLEPKPPSLALLPTATFF